METTVLAWKKLDIAKVTRTYNGTLGCACGCRGSYTKDGDNSSLTVRRRVNLLNKHLAEADAFHWVGESCYELIHSDGKRVTKVYVSESV